MGQGLTQSVPLLYAVVGQFQTLQLNTLSSQKSEHLQATVKRTEHVVIRNLHLASYKPEV